MKFLNIGMFDVAKAAEVAQAWDKFWASPPPGIKLLGDYACLGIAFPGAPPNTLVGVNVIEAESSEVLMALNYPLMLAGSSRWNVPVMELPRGGAAKVEKKIRG